MAIILTDEFLWKRSSLGGNARKKKLSPQRRSEIAKAAALARWGAQAKREASKS